jgi:type II secretory pathway pseudopilin PulG
MKIYKFIQRKRGFTLVELMIAFSIFVVIIGLVMAVIIGGFRSFGQGQKMAQREQMKSFVIFSL